MGKKRVLLPAEEVDVTAEEYEFQQINAPHLTGFMLKLFVKLLEAPFIGPLIADQLKKQNKINEALRNTVIPETPMFKPEYPPQVISFVAALGFMIYGGRLFIMLRRFPIESRGRQKKLHEVGFVTGICCTCFLIRCFVVAFSAFDEDVDVDVLGHPILNLIFYTVVEILPSALVLFILRKLPPRRVSDEYHPIS